jgi:hypothetical protein
MPIRWLPMFAAAALLLGQTAARAEPIADFYRGKTISLYVASRRAAVTISMPACSLRILPAISRATRRS